MRPIIVASLPIKKVEDLYSIEKFLDSDLIELRLDYLKNPSIIRDYYDYLNKYKNKLIITLRDKNEGGKYEINDELKVKLIKEFYDRGFLYDIEALFVKKYNIPYENKIVSVHYFSSLPTKKELIDIINEYKEKAYTVKIALAGIKGYKELLSSLLEYPKVTLIPMSNNPAERIAFGMLGSKLFYSYASEPLAPGQLYYKRAMEIFNYINEIITSSFSIRTL
jgi:3-dehydroquinate dehydratase-1